MARTSSATRSRTTTCSASTSRATDVWAEFQRDRSKKGFAREIVNPDREPLGVKLLEQGLGSLRGAIGTPDQVAELVERFERSGVDQVIFALQTGHTKHEHICESLELFAERVLPRFAERADQVDAERRERLAAACARAVARREPPRKAPRYGMSPPSGPPPPDEKRGGETSARGGGRGSPG